MEENNFRKLLEELKQKYEQILSMQEPKKVNSALAVLKYKKAKIKRHFCDIDAGDLEESQEIFRLLEHFADEIKQLYLQCGETLTHITSVSPENMEDGRIKRSHQRASNDGEKVGDWVFASSEPIDGKNAYIARKSTGMIGIPLASNTYIYGEDSLRVNRDENGVSHVYLKQPNYIYYIHPENFKPVVTLKRNELGKPFFAFSEEWVSEHEVDIQDKKQVPFVREVNEVTPLLGQNQIFCDVNRKQLGISIKEVVMEAFRTGKIEEAYQVIREHIQNGDLRYLNYEADINAQFASKIIDREERREKNGAKKEDVDK